MKDNPLFLLVPTVLIIGVVGFLFLGGKPPSVETFEGTNNTASTTSVVESATNNEVIDETEKTTTDSSIDIFKPKGEDEQWSDRNLLIKEPCDFAEIQTFVDELLTQPEWSEVMDLYPNRIDTFETNGPMDMLVANKWLYNCHLVVSLSSRELSQAEFENWIMKSAFAKALSLLNPTESHQRGVSEFVIGKMPIVFLLADGPGKSSLGTYQYNIETKSVRLFLTQSGFRPTYSIYEADALGKEMCPCVENLTLRVTNKLSEANIMDAIDRGENLDE